MITISNDRLRATINPLGAELNALTVCDNHELIWSRDPAYWPKSAPILFPIIGVMKEDQYSWNGSTYEMPKHGLVRTREWELVHRDAWQASFSIQSSDETMRKYPFQWNLQTSFSLEFNALKVGYQLQNLGETPMLFSLGSHPALALNFGKPEIDDYLVRIFRKGLPLKRRFILEKGLSDEFSDIGDDGKGDYFDLRIHAELFNEDAVIFTGRAIERLEVRSFSSQKSVCIDTGGAPDLGIWAKPGAAYVCIEPWYGYDDPVSHGGSLAKKPGIRTLAAKETFETHYLIQPNKYFFA